MPTESADLVVQESQAVAPATVMEAIKQMAVDPRVDVEKFERLIALQERMVAVQAKQSFFASMARLQPKLPVITKHGRIEIRGTVQSTYAKYEDIDAAIRPLLNEEGFAFSFTTTTPAANTMRIVCRLSHRDGHSEESEVTLPNDTSGSKNGTQGVGSTFSYGKRYLVTSALNIITRDEDDDATKAAYQPISDDNVMKLEDFIHEVGADKAAFLKFMDVERLSQIQNREFAKAMNALKSKQRKVAR